MNRRHHVLLVVAAAVTAVASPGCTHRQESAMTDPTAANIPATVHRDELLSLFDELRRAVAPDATPNTRVAEQDCSEPLTGQTFFGIHYTFDVPGGANGDTALDAMTRIVRARGFVVHTDTDAPGAQLLRASNGKAEFSISGAHHLPLVQLNGSSQCGTRTITSNSSQ